ncbi:hypothetical protein [Inhella gelatinilytica]|uniref:Uncharacterized protein n=1 Tax=Inhella gelatinilytica TaxID=2795030 RepID=A0A931IRT0_9BURK|nr:hypothetical protein [Inhella gelatinilytica]MBH9551500.1 hypothetical protein [Inhella gelatinilytica]
MRVLLFVVHQIWWLAVAYLPIAQFRLRQTYSRSIGCPEAGDCYVPGSEFLLNLDLLIFCSGFVLWPLCVHHFIVRPWLAYRRAATARAQRPNLL